MTSFGNLWERLWRKQYLRQFGRELSAVLPGTDKGMLRRVEARAGETYAARRGEAPDPQGPMVLSTCCLILASYQELIERGVAEERAFEAVRRSFSSIFARPGEKERPGLAVLPAGSGPDHAEAVDRSVLSRGIRPVVHLRGGANQRQLRLGHPTMRHLRLLQEGG